MKIEEEFKLVIENLANRYLDKIIGNPRLMAPVVRMVLADTKKITESNTTVEEQTLAASENILMIMDKSLYLQDYLNKSIETQDFSHFTESDLITYADRVLPTDKEETDKMIRLLGQALAENIANGIELETVYFENYFVEYATTLLEIYVMEHLVERKELLEKAQHAIQPSRQGQIPYGIFQEVTTDFKRRLAENFVDYHAALQWIKEIDSEKESE